MVRSGHSRLPQSQLTTPTTPDSNKAAECVSSVVLHFPQAASHLHNSHSAPISISPLHPANSCSSSSHLQTCCSFRSTTHFLLLQLHHTHAHRASHTQSCLPYPLTLRRSRLAMQQRPRWTPWLSPNGCPSPRTPLWAATWAAVSEAMSGSRVKHRAQHRHRHPQLLLRLLLRLPCLPRHSTLLRHLRYNLLLLPVRW